MAHAQYNAITDNFFTLSNTLLCVIDTQGTLLAVNTAWQIRLQMPVSTLTNSTVFTWVAEEDKVHVQQYLQHLSTDLSPITFTCRWHDIHNKVYWLRWELSADIENNYWYASVFDITQDKTKNKQLKAIDERFQLAIKGANNGLWDWDLITNTVFLSPSWKHLLGYADHEITNHLDALCHYVHPDDFTQMWQKLETYLDRQNSEYESVHRMRHKNGQYCWVLARGAALWDKHQQPYRMVGTYIDITEQKKAEQALYEKEALLNAIFNVTKTGVSVTNEAGEFTHVNPAFCKLYQYNNKELIGKNFTSLLPTEVRERAFQAYNDFLHGQEKRNKEWVIYNRAGEAIDVYMTFGRLMHRDGSCFQVATVTDITKRRQAERALRQSEEHLRLVTSNTPIILFAIDVKGIFTLARGQALTIFKLKDDAVVGQSIFKLLQKFPEEAQQVRYALTGHKVVSVLELSTDIILETTYTPYYNNSKEIMGLIGVSIDVSNRHQLETQLTETVAELETILDNSLFGIAYIKQGKFCWVNSKLEQLLGYQEEELNNISGHSVFVSYQDYLTLNQNATERFRQKKEYDAGHLLRNKQGKSFWCRLMGNAIDYQRLHKGYIWIIEDITLQKQAEQNLQLTATIFETTADGILVTDAQSRMQRVNPAFTNITGYKPDEVCGKKTSFLSSGRHNLQFYQKMWQELLTTGHWQGEIWNRKKTGEIYVAWLSISVIMNDLGQTTQYMAILTDISRLQQDIENVRYLANYDSLTQLPNRLLFTDNLMQAKALAHRNHTQFALFFIDLDNFKPVNDSYGHAVGDLLLQEVAKRLRHCVREIDMVARLGGDEFTLILTEQRSQHSMERIAHKIIHNLEQAFHIQNQEIFISASIGITIYPKDSKDEHILVKNADKAMYAAKHAGRGVYRFYHQLVINNL